ncbi:hypothetical protein Hamer_G007629 [Homarus americanus]|uniref:Uncharacterized protein n=1 Tax=Homarus americanus TaxID=6706 RepID=A0A8J5MR43_HOMAM|nr:hypothetical protein Hamer_G007629 [Homarus americanus]
MDLMVWAWIGVGVVLWTAGLMTTTTGHRALGEPPHSVLTPELRFLKGPSDAHINTTTCSTYQLHVSGLISTQPRALSTTCTCWRKLKEMFRINTCSFKLASEDSKDDEESLSHTGCGEF